MIRTLLTALAFTLMSQGALANEPPVFFYPQEACTTLHSGDHSSPGSSSSRSMIDILCEDENGIHRMYLTSWATLAGFTGFSRSFIPPEIVLMPSPNTDILSSDPTGRVRSPMTVTHPAEPCTRILSVDFSAPGGDSSRYTLEMLCRDGQGRHRFFTTHWATVGSRFGMSRSTHPDVITFVPSEHHRTLETSW